MQNDFKAIYSLYKRFGAVFLFIVLFHPSASADENHYKNVLVGDRAATMGGAYTAISDDSSGSYYNPAGLAFSYGDSISGSGNAYHASRTRYKNVIGGNNDWVRDSTTILPNFFGMIKKFGDITAGVSYIVPDSIIEHQDQKYDLSNVTTQGNVKNYYYSLHAEDKTNLIGPSVAFQFSDTLSMGLSVFYSYRIYRHQLHQFIEKKDGSADTSYQNVKLEEYSYLPKLGIQYSPFEPLFIGVTISKATLLARNFYQDDSKIESGAYSLSNTQRSEIKTYPTQISVGAALYPSPSLIFAFDVDYYSTTEELLENVLNFSIGTEWFLNANNALRAGFFTNNDNRPSCTSSSCNVAKLDMNGLTLGYSSHTRASSFSLGLVYSQGSGKAAPTGDPAEIVDLERTSITVLFAASYNY